MWLFRCSDEWIHVYFDWELGVSTVCSVLCALYCVLCTLCSVVVVMVVEDSDLVELVEDMKSAIVRKCKYSEEI